MALQNINKSRDPWRNGSTSDSRSEGCDSRRVQLLLQKKWSFVPLQFKSMFRRTRKLFWVILDCLNVIYWLVLSLTLPRSPTKVREFICLNTCPYYHKITKIRPILLNKTTKPNLDNTNCTGSPLLFSVEIEHSSLVFLVNHIIANCSISFN